MNTNSNSSRLSSYVFKFVFFLEIFLWFLIYFGHYIYIATRGTSVWGFNFSMAMADSAFMLSLSILVSFFIAYFQFYRKNIKFSPHLSQSQVQPLKSTSHLAFLFLFLYSAATLIFIGNFPALIGSKGAILPGQIITVVLMISCIAFIQQTSAIKFFIKLRFWFFVEAFMLLNLLFTSRFYFLTAIFTLFAISSFKNLLSLRQSFVRFICSSKLKKSIFVVFGLITFSFVLLVQYSLGRASFLTDLSFDLWDVIYQRSVEAIPATAENLGLSSQCQLLSLPKSIFNGFSAFLPNSLKFLFPSVMNSAVYGSAATIHGSFMDNFVSQYACLPFLVKFILLLSFYFLAFWLCFRLFVYNINSSLHSSNVFVSIFALFNQMIVVTRSPAEFWPLAIIGFGLVLPWLIRKSLKISSMRPQF